MNLRNSFVWLLVFAFLSAGSVSAAEPADSDGWESIAPGIDFRQFQLPDPNNVFVARMDRNNPNVTLDSSIAQGTLSQGRESVSGMFSRYDQAINFWGASADPPTWGMRNQVVVAINGSYFDLENGVPQGGQVQSGWYAKPYDKLGGWGGFAWKLDRSAFISECLRNIPENQMVTYPATGVVQQIDNINDPIGGDGLVIFTPQYQARTGSPTYVVEVLVEMTTPAMISPKPTYATGFVREIHVGSGNSLIPFDSIVLAATGTKAQTLLENVQVGSEIHVTQDITSYEYDCQTPYSLNWTGTYASIQGAFFFLKEGEIRDFDDYGALARNPRTAIAYNDQYIYFVVVDGRDYYHSVGMTIHELAEFTRDTLDASWGVAQDGGGSSTMVINGQVVNNTYCNIYTCTGYYDSNPNIFISDNVSDQSAVSLAGNVVISSAGYERTVANGMLMVVAQPAEYSYVFRPGDIVVTRSDTYLRLGPGTNYDGFSIIVEGTQGRIMEQMNNLEGVLANSEYWWYVDFDGVYGWVRQGELVKISKVVDIYPPK
ncbi:MAG: hypothetical protein A2136_03295 [Chloroflexi bacterium RBG_16_54_11]|nr:MAG: hypothetical protein A2136_03295 [Chloroflexi bacterium RBG_16_54_11]